MGLTEWLDRWRTSRAQAKRVKLTRRLCEKYAQSYDRYAAADELNQLGDEAALYALLQRFNVQTPKISEDDDEKKYVYTLLAARGTVVLPAVLRYLREKDALSYPIRLLREVAGDERATAELIGLLAGMRPEYDRVPERKIEIVQALGEIGRPEVVPVVRPFAEDPQDDVVIAVLDALAPHADADENLRGVWFDLLLAEDERPRIRRHVLDQLVERGWKVTGFRKRVEALLTTPYYLDKKGQVKRQGDL